MDLSKLPKFSDSSPPSPTPPEDNTPRPVIAAQAVSLADAWIDIGIGAFLLFWQPRFLQWASSRIFHTNFNEFLDGNNNIVPYQTVPEFWSDLGPTLFGIVMIVNGLLLFTRRPALLWTAFVLTVLATLLNLLWLVGSYSKYGAAPISFLAVIIGGYIAISQWRRLRG